MGRNRGVCHFFQGLIRRPSSASIARRNLAWVVEAMSESSAIGLHERPRRWWNDRKINGHRELPLSHRRWLCLRRCLRRLGCCCLILCWRKGITGLAMMVGWMSVPVSPPLQLGQGWPPRGRPLPGERRCVVVLRHPASRHQVGNPVRRVTRLAGRTRQFRSAMAIPRGSARCCGRRVPTASPRDGDSASSPRYAG